MAKNILTGGQGVRVDWRGHCIVTVELQFAPYHKDASSEDLMKIGSPLLKPMQGESSMRLTGRVSFNRSLFGKLRLTVMERPTHLGGQPRYKIATFDDLVEVRSILVDAIVCERPHVLL